MPELLSRAGSGGSSVSALWYKVLLQFVLLRAGIWASPHILSMWGLSVQQMRREWEKGVGGASPKKEKKVIVVSSRDVVGPGRAEWISSRANFLDGWNRVARYLASGGTEGGVLLIGKLNPGYSDRELGIRLACRVALGDHPYAP